MADNNNEWIYIGIFLDDNSKNKLKKMYPCPNGWVDYYDHMTVVFNDDTIVANAVKSINKKNIGKKFKLKIVGPGISDKAYAIKVELPNSVVCANKISHITLATTGSGRAVDSNYITNWNKIYRDVYIEGIMEVFKPSTKLYGTPLDIETIIKEEANVY